MPMYAYDFRQGDVVYLQNADVLDRGQTRGPMTPATSSGLVYKFDSTQGTTIILISWCPAMRYAKVQLGKEKPC